MNQEPQRNILLSDTTRGKLERSHRKKKTYVLWGSIKIFVVLPMAVITLTLSLVHPCSPNMQCSPGTSSMAARVASLANQGVAGPIGFRTDRASAGLPRDHCLEIIDDGVDRLVRSLVPFACDMLLLADARQYRHPRTPSWRVRGVVACGASHSRFARGYSRFLWSLELDSRFT